MSNANGITHFGQIDHPTLRGRMRHAAIGAMSLRAKLAGAIDSALKRPRVHVIFLHHVFEDEARPFRDLIKTLCATMTPITYSDGVERILSNRIDRPYIAFSFDDGFKNCLTAASILEEFGARACFFVCPNVVGEADRETVGRFARERLHLPPIEFMNWDDLQSLVGRGHEIGNHTKSHRNLAADFQNLDDADNQLADDIGGAAEILQRRIGKVAHFAWPYGRFDAISIKARGMVLAAGHRSCASGQRGAHVVGAPSASDLCLRRDHVIAAWPKSHVMYLLSRSACNAAAVDNDWPPQIGGKCK